MTINAGEPVKATEVNKILGSKINCFQYNVSPQSTVTVTHSATTLIVFLHTFSDCAMFVVRNELDHPTGPKSFMHIIKSGTALSISTSEGQLRLTNNSNVGGTALVLAY